MSQVYGKPGKKVRCHGVTTDNTRKYEDSARILQEFAIIGFINQLYQKLWCHPGTINEKFLHAAEMKLKLDKDEPWSHYLFGSYPCCKSSSLSFAGHLKKDTVSLTLSRANNIRSRCLCIFIL